jgi:predicted membrane channel-forming protein YqfA (hemolysin III family)
VWNNETINIWSHLLGFVLFFFMMLYDNAVFIPGVHGSLADHIIISIGLLCYQVRLDLWLITSSSVLASCVIR